MEQSEEMTDASSTSSSNYSKYWIDWFLSLKGHELFCSIDEEYIVDKFNLTGLNVEVDNYQASLDLILDQFQDDGLVDKDELEQSTKHLYGLIHQRFIITNRGLSKMADKFKRGEFGYCPRVLCFNQPVLPVGLSDIPMGKPVKFYCPKCEDIYHSNNKRHQLVDGAYFGTTFPHLLLQVYPNLIPAKTTERFVPRIFGFKIHEVANLHRRQDEIRVKMLQRLQENQVKKDEMSE